MRALVVLALVLAACTTQPNAATSPTPSPTTPATAIPTQTPRSSPTASPSPISLPSIAQLSAPSGTVVWALVAGERLFRSSDRGGTWEERSIPAAVYPSIIEIAFANDQSGLLMSRTATAQCETLPIALFGTSDGAASWQKLGGSGVADALCKSGLSSADPTHAFFTASKPGSNPIVYRTADGGANWAASAPLPTPPNLAGQATSITITGRPRAFGSIVLVDGGGGQQTKDVFRSTDGGATFSYASTVPTFEGTVAYITATRWLQIATPNSSMETTDGGVSWHAFTTDYSQAAPIAPDIVFGDASVGYATVRGSIQRTVDGGAHWTTIKTPGT